MKIVSWNIAGVPDWANMFGHPTTRVNNILRTLEKIDPDIICLQEVFSNNVRWSLWGTLFQKYDVRMSRQSGILCNGGLLIASKWPIIDYNYYIFKDGCGEDWLAEKGFMNIIVKKGNKKVSIVNTHLNADSILSSKVRSKKKRQKQVYDILAYISQIEVFDYNILCGDLNDGFNSNVVDSIRKTIRKYPFYYYNEAPINTFENRQLDYIFLWGDKILRNIQTVKMEEPILSDHSLLLTNINRAQG